MRTLNTPTRTRDGPQLGGPDTVCESVSHRRRILDRRGLLASATVSLLALAPAAASARSDRANANGQTRSAGWTKASFRVAGGVRSFALAGGAHLVVGTSSQPTTTTGTGAIGVYARQSGKWSRATRVAQLQPSPSQSRAGFGSSIATSGSTIVAAGGSDVAADVYVKPSGGWSGVLSPQATLTAAAPPAGQPVCGTFRAAVQDRTIALACASTNPGIGTVLIYTEPPSGWSGTISPTASYAIDPCDLQEANSPVAITDGGRAVLAAGGCNADDGGGFAPGWYVLRQPTAGWPSASLGFLQAWTASRTDGGRVGTLVAGHRLYMATDQGGRYDVEVFGSLNLSGSPFATLAMPKLPGHVAGLNSIAATATAVTVAQIPSVFGGSRLARCATACALAGQIGVFKAPPALNGRRLRPVATHRLQLTYPLVTAAAGKHTLLVNDARHRNRIDAYAIIVPGRHRASGRAKGFETAAPPGANRRPPQRVPPSSELRQRPARR
jgi:hypothetical protein